MHVQARAVPSRSAANLAEFLRVLAPGRPDDINIEGVTGSSIEVPVDDRTPQSGYFVFAVSDGQEREAHDRLTIARYTVEWTKDLHADMIPPEGEILRNGEDPNQPGMLLRIIERAKKADLAGRERDIDTVLIGNSMADPTKFYAQVTFLDTVWEDQPPEDED